MYFLIILFFSIYILNFFIENNTITRKKQETIIGVSKDIEMYDFIYQFIAKDNLLKLTTNSQLESLTSLNVNKIQFAFLQEDFLKEQIENYKNIKGVVSFVCEYIIVLTKNIINFTNFNELINSDYSIGIDSSYLQTYDYFMRLFDILYLGKDKINRLSKISIYDKKTLINKFINGEIDSIFLLTSNNDKKIANLVKQTSVNFLNININSIDNKDKQTLHNFYKKNYRISSFTNIFYDIDKNDSVMTLGSKIIIASNKFVDSKIVYNFIKFIYQNLIEIRDNISYIENSKYLSFSYKNDINPFSMSFINVDMHEGSVKYLKEIGIYTNNKNLECYKYASIKECEL